MDYHQQPNKFDHSEIEELCDMGTGSTGTVSKVLHKPSGKVMARKSFDNILSNNMQQITNELNILTTCESSFIIGFYGIIDHGRKISILMEYMDAGSVDQLTAACTVNGQHMPAIRMPENVLSEVTFCILSAMRYLDQNKILHRDIKPSNILMNKNGEIKLCDFNVSHLLIGSAASTFVGTKCYMAPERIKGERYKIASDIWSLGLSLMQLAIARYPIPRPTPEEFVACFSETVKLPERIVADSIFDSVRYICLSPPPSFPSGLFSNNFKDLVDECLCYEPNGRPSLDELFHHSFIAQRQSCTKDVAEWIAQVGTSRLSQTQIIHEPVTQLQTNNFTNCKVEKRATKNVSIHLESQNKCPSDHVSSKRKSLKECLRLIWRKHCSK